MPDILTPSVPVLELIARTALVYVLFVAALRVWGKRELGQFTTFDLALLLLAANALQPAITGPDTSVGGAAVIIATIFVLNGAVAFTRRRSGLARHVLTSEPTILARDGAWDQAAVDRENLGQEDLDAALREHGIETVAETQLVVLEEDGSISVVARETDAEALRRRRRRRSRRI